VLKAQGLAWDRIKASPSPSFLLSSRNSKIVRTFASITHSSYFAILLRNAWVHYLSLPLSKSACGYIIIFVYWRKEHETTVRVTAYEQQTLKN